MPHASDATLDPQVLMSSLYVFALGAFLGYLVITRVPPLLHTPLMSATNAISGISLVGSLVIAGMNYSIVTNLLGFVAVTCATINVVGGFVLTDRMLKMFKARTGSKSEAVKGESADGQKPHLNGGPKVGA